MPAAHREIRLLRRQLNGSHFDDNLEPAVLEFLANALMTDVVDFFLNVGFREHWVTNLFPFEISHIVGLLVSFFVSTSLSQGKSHLPRLFPRPLASLRPTRGLRLSNCTFSPL